jgi:hypothetical protein
LRIESPPNPSFFFFFFNILMLYPLSLLSSSLF